MPTGDSVYLGVVYRYSYLADVVNTGCDMCNANLLRKIAQVYHSRQDKGKHFLFLFCLWCHIFFATVLLLVIANSVEASA
jgi:hypothetical protein